MRTLASALAQEEFDLDVVVVDDGSSDDTAATVAALDDRRVSLVRRVRWDVETLGRDTPAS